MPLLIAQVTLGVLMKNENTREDMVAIAEHVIGNYVPIVASGEADEDKTYGRVPFVGDQLTVERLRNIQRTRRTADSVQDRLEPLIPMVADWHAKQSLYGVCICIYSQSIFDIGVEFIYMVLFRLHMHVGYDEKVVQWYLEPRRRNPFPIT